MSVNPSLHTESRLEMRTLKLQWDPSEWNFAISPVEPKAAEHLGVGNVDALNVFELPSPPPWLATHRRLPLALLFFPPEFSAL